MKTILNTPRFRVVYLDGSGQVTEVPDVQAVQADVVRFDLLRRKYNFPPISEAPMLWTSVVAWAALVREGADIPAEWNEALPRLLDVTTLSKDGSELTPDDDPESATGVDPTPGQA